MSENEPGDEGPRPSRGPIYLGLAFLAIFIMVTIGVLLAFRVDPTPGGVRKPFEWEHLKEQSNPAQRE